MQKLHIYPSIFCSTSTCHQLAFLEYRRGYIQRIRAITKWHSDLPWNDLNYTVQSFGLHLLICLHCMTHQCSDIVLQTKYDMNHTEWENISEKENKGEKEYMGFLHMLHSKPGSKWTFMAVSGIPGFRISHTRMEPSSYLSCVQEKGHTSYRLKG